MPQIGRYPESMSIAQVIAMMKDIRNSQSPLDEELIEQFQLHEIQNKKITILNNKDKINQNFYLKSKVIELKEVVVSSRKSIVEKKDTIIFDAKSFLQGNEQVVEDLLK